MSRTRARETGEIKHDLIGVRCSHLEIILIDEMRWKYKKKYQNSLIDLRASDRRNGVTTNYDL